jgi:hypothetical protein
MDNTQLALALFEADPLWASALATANDGVLPADCIPLLLFFEPDNGQLALFDAHPAFFHGHTCFVIEAMLMQEPQVVAELDRLDLLLRFLQTSVDERAANVWASKLSLTAGYEQARSYVHDWGDDDTDEDKSDEYLVTHLYEQQIATEPSNTVRLTRLQQLLELALVRLRGLQVHAAKWSDPTDVVAGMMRLACVRDDVTFVSSIHERYKLVLRRAFWVACRDQCGPCCAQWFAANPELAGEQPKAKPAVIVDEPGQGEKEGEPGVA